MSSLRKNNLKNPILFYHDNSKARSIFLDIETWINWLSPGQAVGIIGPKG
jgi:hypothetical protein